MRWPPINDCFVLGFNPQTAREIKARGWIVLDGRYAKVRPASLADDDERIDFEFCDPPLEAEVAA